MPKRLRREEGWGQSTPRGSLSWKAQGGEWWGRGEAGQAGWRGWWTFLEVLGRGTQSLDLGLGTAVHASLSGGLRAAGPPEGGGGAPLASWPVAPRARPCLRKDSAGTGCMKYPPGGRAAAHACLFGPGGGGPGHQRTVSEVPSQARRAHELPVLHAA